jgi:rhamnogalacturonan endolyase
VAWQNVGYNQPPHTSFYMGHDMKQPPNPDAVEVKSQNSKVKKKK